MCIYPLSYWLIKFNEPVQCVEVVVREPVNLSCIVMSSEHYKHNPAVTTELIIKWFPWEKVQSQQKPKPLVNMYQLLKEHS